MDENLAYILYTDGGSRGNPGPAGIGYLIYDLRFTISESKVVKEGRKYIGIATNNVAEYSALIAGLEGCAELGARQVEVKMDSELVVKQLKGEYRIKDKTLFDLASKVKELESSFKKITYKHIPREQNKEADRLVNEILDSSSNSKC